MCRNDSYSIVKLTSKFSDMFGLFIYGVHLFDLLCELLLDDNAGQTRSLAVGRRVIKTTKFNEEFCFDVDGPYTGKEHSSDSHRVRVSVWYRRYASKIKSDELVRST
jgi:hypothetical protein